MDGANKIRAAHRRKKKNTALGAEKHGETRAMERQMADTTRANTMRIFLEESGGGHSAAS